MIHKRGTCPANSTENSRDDRGGERTA